MNVEPTKVGRKRRCYARAIGQGRARSQWRAARFGATLGAAADAVRALINRKSARARAGGRLLLLHNGASASEERETLAPKVDCRRRWARTDPARTWPRKRAEPKDKKEERRSLSRGEANTRSGQRELGGELVWEPG